MPRSAPKPCRYAGCRGLTQRGVLCDEHRAVIETTDDRRPGPSRRGYDRHWRRLRLWYLHRHPICEWPGCRLPASQVDHIVPLSRGGAKSDPSNLQALCHSHHSRKTTTSDGGFGRTPWKLKAAKDANMASYGDGGALGHANDITRRNQEP